MYKKSAKGWLKHWDFILWDLLCLHVAFVIAYMIRHGARNPYTQPLYLREAIALILIQVVVSIGTENFKNVLKRGYYKEFTATAKQALFVTLFSSFYLLLMQQAEAYSRMTLLMTGAIYIGISYPVRSLWKKYLLSGTTRLLNQRSLLVITDMNRAEKTMQNVKMCNYSGYYLKGAIVVDQDMTGETICAVPVVADVISMEEYICREWVDEVMVNLTSDDVANQVVEMCSRMGVTVHRCLPNLSTITNKRQRMERIGNYTVLTTSVIMVTTKQLLYKRILDIVGAIVGCLLTGILFFFVAPAIYIKSPGPIFFSQIRVGRNGKKFKMYKFRSMYTDAEERKKELMAQNQIEDGMMFKMKDDPRIIKGIGHFIRKTSIDEFPQFFNVLKGDMSLVGTRPPTVDEWEKYSLHHRVRLAIKPGITGMWQVSGRNDITDFEEVVKLDAKYIDEWSLGLDLKILAKTVAIVIGNNGAM